MFTECDQEIIPGCSDPREALGDVPDVGCPSNVSVESQQGSQSLPYGPEARRTIKDTIQALEIDIAPYQPPPHTSRVSSSPSSLSDDTLSPTSRSPLTLPSRRTHSPPRKRRRTRNAAQKFFDIEAREDDDEEDKDDADAEDVAELTHVTDLFIDDEPNHLFPVDIEADPLDMMEEREMEARELELIAAHYDQRARAESRAEPRTERDSFSPGPSGTPETIWDALQDPPVSRLPPENAPPFYVIRTPQNFELQLIDYLVDCGIVISAGTIGVGSRVVFVELEYIRIVHKRDDRVDPIVFTPLQVLIGALKQWPSYYRMRRHHLRPVEIPPEQRYRLLLPPGDPNLLHPFDSPYGRFVRVQSNGLYHSDLGFLADQYSLWIVLHFEYDMVPAPRHKSQRPSQAFFSEAKFRATLPAENLTVLPNRYGFKWGSRFFDAITGFEVIEPEKLQFTNVNVIPTAAELSYFVDSGATVLNVPFKGYACALQEGDCVVVPEGTSSMVPAYIIRTFERSINGQRVRFTVLIPSTRHPLC
ncbi:hypothetical protein GGX14DRAFT_395439 [Mycena pura]|uniref:Uncharacterized protein n=1 Tax=Mycena pura TaxID=153505 RepID=A0AAD6VH14_9AGAR|nr:hypothetical protein GGX14DRAFT_395439 [Mycena pura]